MKKQELINSINIFDKPVRSVQADPTKIITGCYNKNVYLLDFLDSKETENTGVIKKKNTADKQCTIS